jgi:hypothetical protein
VWHHTQREGVTGVTRVSQKLERVEKWKRGPIVVGVPEPVFPPATTCHLRRQAHDRKLPCPPPPTDTHTSKTRPVHKLETAHSHDVEWPTNTPAKRLA